LNYSLAEVKHQTGVNCLNVLEKSGFWSL